MVAIMDHNLFNDIGSSDVSVWNVPSQLLLMKHLSTTTEENQPKAVPAPMVLLRVTLPVKPWILHQNQANTIIFHMHHNSTQLGQGDFSLLIEAAQAA
jgi:hypothetical protein